MKRVVVFLIFLFFQGFVFAQIDDAIIGGTPADGVIQIKKSEPPINPTNDLSNQSYQKPSPASPTGNSTEVGITAGELSVSLTGGATYDIPIALPPGINGVVPQISLSYNSQSGNGLAGYGWNISGVSVITRIPATKFHDGTIDAVDFDNLDRFSLDGQRLVLKTGLNAAYGTDGAKYETEIFSNLRITSYGVHHQGADYGPAYFKVEYPDGSFAFYGHTTNSRSINDWAITYWQNPQGVRISYTYTEFGNNLSVKHIKYGHREGESPVNEITFVYTQRQRSEQAYVGGQNFERNAILSEIKVKGNGVGYRNYYLNHDVTSLGYERLKSITEKSGDDSVALNPTKFTYNTTSENLALTPITNLTGFGSSIHGVRADNSSKIVGDFNGDGKMDFILYPTTGAEAKKKYWLFSKWENGYDYMDIIEHGNINFKEIFPVSWLSYENKLMPAQGWCIVSETSTNKVKFQTCSRGISIPILLQDEKSYDFPKFQYSYYKKRCHGKTEEIVTIESIVPKIYLNGDFNGDGLSDIVAIEKKVTVFYVTDCNHYSASNSQGASYFIELDRRKTTNFVKYSGVLETTDNSKIYVADFNGDGKSDILIFDSKSLKVYSLNDNNKFEKVYSILNDNAIGVDESSNPIILGDYNGDGKTDFLIPNGYGNHFYRYISTGKGYVKSSHSYGVSHTKSEKYKNGSTQIYYLIPNDFDLDGKTDLIVAECRGFNNPNSNSQTYIKVKYYKNTGSNFQFMAEKSTGYQGDKIIHYPSPIFLDVNGNSNSSISFMTDNSLYTFESEKSNVQDMLLRSITYGNGLKEAITYQPLEPYHYDSNNFDPPAYQPSYSETYPNFDIERSNNFHIVSKIEQVSQSQYKQQRFNYYGAVTNLEGLGFLGFKGLHRSSWFDEDGYQATSTTTKHDITKRGAITETLTLQGAYSTAFTTSPNGYISKTTMTYQDELLSNKVYKIKNTYSVLRNALDGFSKTISTTYDQYNNPLSVTSSFYNGVSDPFIIESNLTYKDLKTFEYDNNTTYSGTYYIGRPKKLQTERKIFGTQSINSISPVIEDTRTSEELYTYNAQQLPTKIQKKGHNTDYLTEENMYDVFGNITKKTITANDLTPRKTEYTYDSTGRFLLTSKDVEGLVTSYSYDNSNGNLLSETLPHNAGYPLTTTFEYDKWNRQTKIIDYLSKTTTTTYFKPYFDTKTIAIYTVKDDGGSSLEMFNQLGQKVAVLNNAISTSSENLWNSDWHTKMFRYDINNRITHENELLFVKYPSEYINGSQNDPQWNTTTYDLYGRVTKKTLYTGKTTNFTYNGLTVTSDDGVKATTITKNAVGNIVSLSDNGGTITYKHYADGNIKETNYQGVIVSVEQDGWGRKTKLTDPSAGQYTYEYNGFGELTRETTPKGQTIYFLNNFGKIEQKLIFGDNTNSQIFYDYNNTTKLLSQITIEDIDEDIGTIYDYHYDNYRRLWKTTESGPLASYERSTLFDDFGRPEKEYYKATVAGKTSEKQVKNTYKNGYHWQILDDQTQQILWQTNTINARGQLSSGLFGNGVAVTNTYDDYGFPKQIKHQKTGGQNHLNMQLETNFDPQRGNLLSRKTNLFDWDETFVYDELDRLTQMNQPQLLHYNDFKESLDGFYPNAGATLTLENERLKVTGTQAYARTQKTITESASIGDMFNVQIYVDRGNTQEVRAVIVESNPQTGQWNQSIKRIQGNPELIEFQHTVSQYPVVAIHIDKSDTSDTGTLTYFFVDDFKAYKMLPQQLVYDQKGRITNDSNLGEYLFENTDRPYQNTGINLTDSGHLYYSQNQLQSISYNVFKAPVDIYEQGKERLSFRYNAFGQRSTMFYGGLQQDKMQRPLRKHYSADGSMEIKQNIQTGQIEFITYIGGDAYTAPVVYRYVPISILPIDEVKTGIGTQNELRKEKSYLYLHRDYQGSIIAVSNESGQLIEKRLFDAWGNILKVQNGQEIALSKLSVLDRGYTGHEHLQKVNLIHMNGRLYDPVVHRFLQPDNFVQDPYNTQNFNRYGYCLNNPFMYVDYSGETRTNNNDNNNNGLLQIAGSFIVSGIAASWDEIKGLQFNHWADGNLRSIGKDIERYGKDTGKFFENVGNEIGKFFGFGKKSPSSVTIPSMSFSDTSSSLGWHENTTFVSVAQNTSSSTIAQTDGGSESIWSSDIVRTIADFVPGVGSGWDIYEGIETDDYWQVGIGSVSLIADIATFGGSAIIKGAVKTGIKQSGKHLAKGIVKKESKVLLNQFNSVESLVQGAGKLTKVKAGMQGFVKGDGPSIFNTITQGGKLQSNGQYLMQNGTQIGNHFSKTTGTFTIHITPTTGKMIKIRIMP